MKAITALVLAIMLALSIVASATPLTTAAGDALKKDGPHVRAVEHLGGSSLAVALRGGYAFVGSSAEFAVVDLHNVQQPHRLAYLPLAANDVVLHDNYAYITNRSGLVAIDISDPAHPQQVASAPATRPLNGLTIAGHHIFAIAPEGGLFVYDIAEPVHLQQVGFMRILGAEGIAVQGSFAYLATSSGLRIMDVADPRRPTLTTFAGIPQPVEGVAAADRYLYLSVMPGALLIADAAAPAAPVLVGGISLPIYTKNLQVAGSKVFVANGNSGVAVVDAADPRHPRLLGTSKVGALITDLAVTEVPATGTACAGEMIVATDVSEGGFHILCGSDPRQLAAIGSYRVPGVTTDAAALDRYVYLVTGMDGDVTIVDYSAQGLAGVGFLRTPEQSATVRVYGDRLYIYGENNLMRVMDIADPVSPSEVGARSLSGGVRLLAARGQHAFLADAAGMLHVYDMAATGVPLQVGLFAVAGEMNDAAMTDAYVLVAAGAQGVLAAHYGGTTLAVPFQRIPITGCASHIAAQGPTAFVLSDDGTLFTLDLAAPGAPLVTDQLALGAEARALLLCDNHLYLPAGEDGVYVVAVDQFGALGSVTVYDTPGTALNVDVRNNRIFVADGYAGLTVLELAD